MDERDTLQQIEEFLQRQLENRTGDVYLYRTSEGPKKDDSVLKDLATLESLLQDVADLVGNISGLRDEMRKLEDRIRKVEERIGGRQDGPVEGISGESIGESIIKSPDARDSREPTLEQIAVERKREEADKPTQSREMTQLRDRVNWVVIQVMQLLSHVGELFRRDARRREIRTDAVGTRVREIARKEARDAVDAKLQELLQADVKNLRDMLGRVLAQQRFIIGRFGELTQKDQNIEARMQFLHRQIDWTNNSIPQIVTAMLNARMVNVARDIARLDADIRNAELTVDAALADARDAKNIAIGANNRSFEALNTARAALREAMLAQRRISASGVFD